MNTTDYAARVADAAEKLDEHAGLWWTRHGGRVDALKMPLPAIDLSMLDMQLSEDCVLGQLFGDYTDAPYALGLKGHPGTLAQTTVPDTNDVDVMTAYADATKAEYAALTEAWRTLIEARRNGNDG